jgi:hypothetical protein
VILSRIPDVECRVANTYNLSATVKTFTAGLDCERATLEDNINLTCEKFDCKTELVYMTATANDCRISDFRVKETNTGTYHDGWFGHDTVARCDTDEKGDDRERVVITVLYLDSDLYMNGDSSPNIKNSTTLFCKPSFSIQHDTVTIDETGAIIRVDRGEPLQTPHEINSSSISRGVLKSIVSDNAGEMAYGYNESVFKFDSFVRLALVSQGSTIIDDLSNFELLAKGAHEIYKGVAVQLAKQYLLDVNVTESGRRLEGVAYYEHQRLFVRKIILRAVETILGILMLLSMYLALRPRWQLPPQDVASIARFSAAISKSKDLMDALSGAGAWSCRNLKHLLQGTYSARYKLAERDVRTEDLAFVIEGYRSAEKTTPDPKVGYWKPLMITWYVRVALLVAPLAIIITLETLLRLSHRDSGLCDILQNKQTQLGATVVPAIVMALTKLLYSGYDFNVRILDPYVQLHNRSATAKSSVLNKTIYTWKTDAFWSAFMNKRYAVGASTLSVTIAAFLTIAASGLFTTTPMSRSMSLEVTQLDQISFPGNESVYAYDSEAIVRKARLVAYEEIGNSNWTYGQYALPTITPPSSGSNTINTTSMDLEIPVHRGFLNCTIVPSEQITLNYTSSDTVLVRWPDLVGCTTIVVPTFDGDQEMQPMYGMTNGSFGRWSPVSFVNPDRDGCPVSWGIYGTWLGQSAAELNVVQCWSSVQEVQASVRLSMPGQRIVSLATIEATSRDIITGPRSNMALERLFPKKYSEPVDGPFSIFIRGETPGTFDHQLLHRENFNKLNERIQKVFGLVAAELFSSLHRNTTLVDVNPVIKATATYSVMRLIQNEISTRILQALLVSMVICALVSLFTVRLSKILPKNPCSIAAQASLVAGSEMMSRLPPEAQWMDDKEFDVLFKGEKYAMGWSVDRDGNERFGVDIDELQSGERNQAVIGLLARPSAPANP